MTYFLLEDEDLAAGRMQQFIRQYDPQARIMGWEKSIQNGLKWLSQNPSPDLVFSDIELLDGNAFQLFAQVNLSSPVIFATAYDQFLLKAFQTNGIAYLLKPYDYEQFVEAMQKYERLVSPKTGAPTLTPALVAELKMALQPAFQQLRQRFTVRKNSGIFILQVSDIAYFLAEEKVVFACTADGKRHAINHTLNEIEAELDPRQFFRLNRGELIHLPFVEKLDSYGKDRLCVYMKGGTQPLISSVARTSELRDWIGN